MRENEYNYKRKTWAAAVLSMVMPGLGQMYNGELLKGVCFFMGSVLIAFSGLYASVYFQDKLILPFVCLCFIVYMAVYILAVIDAFRASRKTEEPIAKKSYNRWFFYLFAWTAGVFIMFCAAQYINGNIFVQLKIAGRSMEPEIKSGDIVLLDKTAGERTPYSIGDIVVFNHFDGKTRLLMRRVHAVAGQEITLRGQSVTVPPSCLFVESDNANLDNHNTEELLVPVNDIIGKVRIIF